MAISEKTRKNWESITLGQLFRIKHGFAFKGEYFSKDGDYLLLTPGNFKEEGGLKIRDDKEKYYIGDFPYDFILKKGDLLVVMTDLKSTAPILGSSAFIPENNKFLHNQRLGKIINLNDSKVDIKFLYYLFNHDVVRSQVKGSATGSTVRHTSPERIYEVRVSLPPLPIQRKIADILSAYDELIENNTRQIKILEEMAALIYREWFVNFRFPGHEQVKMVDSQLGCIPEGWEVKLLEEVAAINASTIKKQSEIKEINYIDISSVSTGKIDKIETISFVEAPSRARRIVKHGDIIWSTVRPNRKAYSCILNPEPNLIVSTGFAVITAINVPYTYLYYAVTTEDFVSYLTKNATGSAYPAVNSEDFKKAKVLIPSQDIVTQFNTLVEDIFQQKQFTQLENINLRKTRDLLLPKLISGEIDLETLNTPEINLWAA